MVQPSCTVAYRGQPLDVLQRLIDRRRRYCWESAKDSVIGTAITALVSIRSMTTDARKRRNLNGAFDVVDTGFYGGYSNTLKARCVRNGISKYSPKVQMDAPVVFPRRTAGARQYLQHIYKVTTTRTSRGKPIGVYYLCAYSVAEARAYEEKKIRKNIARTGGLALNALSAAMRRCSSRNPPAPTGSRVARTLGDKCAVVREVYNDSRFTVDVIDTLNYALSAVKGGQAGVDLALKKAANKISGMIRHHWHTPLHHDVGTPFPEIVRNR